MIIKLEAKINSETSVVSWKHQFWVKNFDFETTELFRKHNNVSK